MLKELDNAQTEFLLTLRGYNPVPLVAENSGLITPMLPDLRSLPYSPTQEIEKLLHPK
ncbi:MAG: hypothetical protein F6K13_30785 [Okeania sp. SIO2B9]|nr:hypothetical protein [Okeania sp. SIO2B9]